MLEPFEPLFAQAPGQTLPLPPDLLALYGSLAFPTLAERPYVISNFVSTLDGVVSLGIPGKSGGGEISGFNRHDRALMGLLRAVAGAVVVGAGTLRAVPRHLWTAEYVFPALGSSYQDLRRSLGLGPTPLNVIISGSGQLDLTAPVFASGAVRTLIVTTLAGADRLLSHTLPDGVKVRAVQNDGSAEISVEAVLAEVVGCLDQPAPVVLLEGGPRVMGDFFAERQIDELFLTLAPQVAGRKGGPGLAERPGLVAGRLLAPDRSTWSTLVSVHRAGSHLFLRYRFERQPAQ
jgi:riboflavin biosynthesis pyrimidine reductase